jgi:hypothetical protein
MGASRLYSLIFLTLALVSLAGSVTATATTPLEQAIMKGEIDKAKTLLEQGVNINEINVDGERALIYAANKGNIEVVKLLLDKGADVNAKCIKCADGTLPGATALVYAAANGEVDMVKLLLDKGADIEATVAYGPGLTALDVAIQTGNTYIMKVLVERGANIEKALGKWQQLRFRVNNPQALPAFDRNIALIEKFIEAQKTARQSIMPSSPQAKETSSAQPKEVAPAVFLPIPANVNFGNYYAVIIGNNAYKYLPKLATAVKDAHDLADLLQKDYGFKVTLLTDATRQQIIDALDQIRRTLTEQDNLLIYYAGHGWLDVEADRGFWLPVDAEENRRANWLSNSDITDTVRSTMAKHVLVVVDSCYAGTLTRGVAPQLDNPALARLAQKRARTALTSGGLEPVADTGGEGHSVFAKAFLDALKGNQGVVDMGQLSSTIRYQVMLGAQQTPQYGDIRQTGHEGGDFLFVRQH